MSIELTATPKRSFLQWITGRGSKATVSPLANGNGHAGTNGHARGGRPQASSMLAITPEAKHLADIVEQMRPDYQVTFCERILQANAAAVRVTIAAEGESPVAESLATKLQELWDRSISGMADDVAYGRVAHEKVWDCESDAAAGVNEPYHFIRKLEPLPFRESRMKLESDGSFAGIEIKTKANDWALIPPFDSWWQALDATAKQPHGRSRFLPAPYEVWKEKAGAKRNRTTATSKFALRGPIIRGPIQDMDETTQESFDVLTEMAPAVDIWSKGGLLYLNNDRHPGAPESEYKYTIEQADMQGFDPSALNTIVERYDVEMCRAFGIPEQTIIEAGAVGTYGSIAQKMLILFATVEDILSQRVQSFEAYVIRPCKEVNGLPESVKITATFVPLTKRPDAFVFEVIKLLLANPVFIEGILSGGVDLREILTQAGLPVTDELERVLLAVAQRMAAAGAAAMPVQPANTATADGQPALPLAAEYAATGRRQWQNNVKAIRDVLGDLIAGNTSETMATELLQALGLTPERAAVLIADAKDNATIDDPELQAELADTLASDGITLAQVAVPGQGFKVPQAEQLLNQGLREFDRLFDALVDAMARKASKATLDGIRDQIVMLEADLRTAGRVLGMLSPWQPRVNTYAGGEGTDADRLSATVPADAIALADKSKPWWRFPWITSAVEFLASKAVVTAKEFAKLAAADRVHVFSAPGIDSAATLKNLQKKLSKSLELGEDLRTFRKSIEADVSLTRAQTETMYRTETKRGYVAGFDKAMRSPVVQDEFPAVALYATSDTRVRDSHWDVDGFTTLRSDPAYRVLKRLTEDYNCRCALVALSLKDAERQGLKTYNDLPASVRAKYG